MRYLTILFFVGLLVGCQSPCLICHVPDSVKASTEGQIVSLRAIESDLVDPMAPGKGKDLWKQRLAAFITEARALKAWAHSEEFDLGLVLDEEKAK